MKGQRRLPSGTEFRSVAEIIAEPERWRLLMGQATDQPIDHLGAPRAAVFTERGVYGSASILNAPSGMLVLVIEIPESER